MGRASPRLTADTCVSLKRAGHFGMAFSNQDCCTARSLEAMAGPYSVQTRGS